jgi:tyrosyl-DNA phosphodiesterase 2
MVLLSRACFSSHDTATLEDKETQKQVQDAEAQKLQVGRVFLVPLPSKYNRDALCVDVNFSAAAGTELGTIVRFVNVHLDSLGHTLQYRIQQMQIATSLLREPGCSAGLIAGDFNAICPRDHKLLQENELIDAWNSLHGMNDGGGATWGFAARQENRPGLGRLDKIAMVGLRPKEFTLLRPGDIEVPRPGEESIQIPWSDHCGLHCAFAL